MTDHAIVVRRTGDASVLVYESVDVAAPGPGEVLVRHHAIGVNFIDIYHRIGLYPTSGFPFTPGTEAAGVVEAVGADVTDLRVGMRVGYATGPLGAYAERRVVPAHVVVPLPDSLSFERAAAILLKGMTAEYLAQRTVSLPAGATVLVHAAAGGTGSLLCQWLAHRGVTVIGTVSTDEKAAFARDHGCAHVVVYSREDFVARSRELTQGRGVDVVYDSVGRDTFERSLECLRLRGTMVAFGQASGAVPPLDITLLSRKGALHLTRPTLFAYTATREELVASARDLFALVSGGVLDVTIGARYPLAHAADAHRALESRGTHGATVLLPSH